MVLNLIEFKINSASENKIFSHLEAIGDAFVPSLKERVDIADYSYKLYHKAETFEAWIKSTLVGLVAAYFNENETGFISNVSVLKGYQKRGIANRLIKDCINFAKESKIKRVLLEVGANNLNAIELYKSVGFEAHDVKKDTNLMILEL